MKNQTTNIINPYIPIPRKNYTPKTSPIGCSKIIRADLVYSKEGIKTATPGQVLDLDAMIQAAKDSTDIAAIVARAKLGDESVLNVNPGFVGDSVSLPKDIYDYKAMNDLYDKVSGSFESLPDGLKAAFGDANNYMQSILNNTVDSIVKQYNESIKNNESEVNDNA